MTSATQEKKSRRTRDEILTLVDKAEKLISNGTPKTEAAKQVSLAYGVLAKHLGEGVKSESSDDEIRMYVGKLTAAIEKKVRKDILRRI